MDLQKNLASKLPPTRDARIRLDIFPDVAFNDPAYHASEFVRATAGAREIEPCI